MVCLGNICRSPLAEGILKKKVDSNRIFVDSAGTGGYHIGNKPDIRSIAVAKKYGIDISQQTCRKFNSKDFTEFDIIYVMDKSNYNNVVRLTNSPAEISKVQLLLNEVDLLENEVPDPYYETNDGFEHVFQLINTACTEIAQKLA